VSPSEFDLRAALREGEGDVPSADRVLLAARRQRAHRRSVLLSTAAVVVVVAGAGFGVAELAGGGATGSANRAARSMPSPAGGQAAGSTSNRYGATRNSVATTAVGVPCPATQPHFLLPGGGSPGQFGSGGQLFDGPVASVVVCAYGSEAAQSSTPARLVLTGADATALADSLENAAKVHPSLPCPTVADLGYPLAIRGVTAGGRVAGTVTTTLGEPACATTVTDGTAVRYDWSPPARLRPILDSLTRRLLPRSAPTSLPGTMHGSPIHS
jgi:hypothetical protein